MRTDRKISELSSLARTELAGQDLLLILDQSEPVLSLRNKSTALEELYQYIYARVTAGGETLYLLQGANSTQEGFFKGVYTNTIGSNSGEGDSFLTIADGVRMLSSSAILSPYFFDSTSGKTGIDLATANTVIIKSNDIEKLRIDSSGLLSFGGDTDTGIRLSTTNELSLRSGAADIVVVSTDAATINGLLKLAQSGQPTLTIGRETLTSDRQINFPNVNGIVVTTGDTGTITSTMIANGTIVDVDISSSAEIAVSKLADGAARQLLQTSTDGNNVEWTSNVDIPGTLDVSGVSVFDSSVSISGQLALGSTLVFEGATPNDFETTLSVVDPTSDNTIVLPNISGTVVTSGDTGTVTNTMLAGSIGNAKLSNSSITINSSATSLGGSVTLYAGTTTLQTSSANQGLTGISSIALPGATSGTITVTPAATAGTTSITIPATSGTLITTGDTGTVTNTMLAGSIADSKLSTINTADKISLSALNIDGGTDIGAALVDADLFIVDDGGDGTNRKAAVTRISDYVFGKVTGDVTIASNGTAAIGSGVIVDADISATAEIAVSKLADGAARQLLQTAANGSDVEWTDNVDLPGTLDVTGQATFDSGVYVRGSLVLEGTTDDDFEVTISCEPTADRTITLPNATGTLVVSGAIADADIASGAAIAGSKIQAGSTSNAGALQLTNSTSSTSTTTAATPNAVKSAYDLAAAAQPKVRAVEASATSGSLTPNGDTTDLYLATGLTGAITLAAPSGTPTNGQRLMIRLKDNGTARGITWTTSSGAYRAIGITLPTTTVLGKVTYVGCIYNSTDSYWDAVATVTEA